MEISQVKDYIISNTDHIGTILENASFFKVTDKGDRYWCGWNEDTSGTTIYVKKDTLASVDFPRNISGDIITLIEAKLNLGFRGTIKWICMQIGLEYDSKPVEITRPFGGYYMNCDENKELNECALIEYGRDILREYKVRCNLMFLNDGISLQVQEEFSLGYDTLSGRISIPVFDEKGRLVGIDGRVNKRNVEGFKWMPIVPFKKSQVLFGYSKNYHNLVNGIVLIGESPKFVMQLMSMGINNGVALGCANITPTNAKNLQSLFAKEYILCLDEGIDEDYMIKQCEKLKIDNPFFTNKVSYIYDGENNILPKGSKMSPSDVSKDKFKWLIENCKTEVF